MTFAFDPQIARDVTYANEARSRFGRIIIRLLEALGGRMGLIKKVQGYEEAVAAGENFWELMCERYGVTLEIVEGSLENIPRDRAVIIVANHPYGILDGLTLGLILSRARGEFKIIANHVFRRAKDVNDVILPINFEEGDEALQTNLNTRKVGIEVLKNNGAIGIFPGGTVSTSLKPMGEAFDPSWARFPTKFITRTDAVVVPIYFEGCNSRLFQIASHLHANLRLGLLIHEFRRRRKKPVRVRIGTAIERVEMEPYFRDPAALKNDLRKRTYQLGKKAAPNGHEFDPKYRSISKSGS